VFFKKGGGEDDSYDDDQFFFFFNRMRMLFSFVWKWRKLLCHFVVVGEPKHQRVEKGLQK